MVARVPKVFDPIALADKNANITGELPLADFTRMAELLFDDNNTVAFQLNFFKEGHLVKVTGLVSATLHLKCQRCLEPLTWIVNSDIKLGVVNSLDKLDRLPEGFEPLLLNQQGTVTLVDIIEDEVLLGLPTIPKHQEDCEIIAEVASKSDVLIEKSIAKQNPFAILADFKTLENQNGSTKK